MCDPVSVAATAVVDCAAPQGASTAEGMRCWPTPGSGLFLHKVCSTQGLDAQGGCSVSHLPVFCLYFCVTLNTT